MLAAGLVSSSQFGMNASSAIASAVLLEDLLNERPEFVVPEGSLGDSTPSVGVVTGPTDVQEIADAIDREAFSIEDNDDLMNGRQPFRLKMAKAFFRMSRSRSSRRT